MIKKEKEFIKLITKPISLGEPVVITADWHGTITHLKTSPVVRWRYSKVKNTLMIETKNTKWYSKTESI